MDVAKYAGEAGRNRNQSVGTGNPVGGGALGAKEEEGARERQSAPPVVGVPEAKILKNKCGSLVLKFFHTCTRRRIKIRLARSF